MRLRCPENNCPIDVPDDLVGVRIRCPHCGASIVVDSQQGVESASQIKAGGPGAKSNDAPNLENQIYDGLPPLAVMMALKRQKGIAYDAHDFASKFEMTEDDWRALTAFEFVLRASYQIRTAFGLGLTGMMTNVTVVAAMAAYMQGNDPGPYAAPRALGNLGSMALLMAGLALVWMLGSSFRRLRAGQPVAALPGVTLGIALVLAGSASINLLTLAAALDDRLVLLMMGSAAISGVAAFAALSACWRVVAALVRVRPPEIHIRLAEAIKYLPD